METYVKLKFFFFKNIRTYEKLKLAVSQKKENTGM